MGPNLDLDTLRTLVVATEVGGFGHAAKRLGRTASAVSLQMKRLREAVGAPLFRKSGRAVVLTEAGALALAYARRMLALNDELLDTVRGASLRGNARLGCTQDFAEIVLPVVLERYARLYPLMQIEVRIEGNAALADAVSTGQLDLALVIGHAQRATARTLGELPLVWIAGPRFVRRDDQPLPLVMLGPQCAFRQEAARLLEARSWRLAAVSPSLAGIWASARGGLGVTLRSPLGLPADFQRGEALFDLPRPGTLPITLQGRVKGASEGIKRLSGIVTEAVAESMTALAG
jgi:DNA-binding transcriptional LysR family regulator